MRVMFAQMLDLNGYVVAEIWKFAMHGLDNRQRMRRSVEEIRIAECDVPRARRHLLPDVRKHYVAFHHAKRTVKHRHDRTVPAKVLAAARRLGRTCNALLASRHDNARIF